MNHLSGSTPPGFSSSQASRGNLPLPGPEHALAGAASRDLQLDCQRANRGSTREFVAESRSRPPVSRVRQFGIDRQTFTFPDVLSRGTLSYPSLSGTKALGEKSCELSA